VAPACRDGRRRRDHHPLRGHRPFESQGRRRWRCAWHTRHRCAISCGMVHFGLPARSVSSRRHRVPTSRASDHYRRMDSWSARRMCHPLASRRAHHFPLLHCHCSRLQYVLAQRLARPPRFLCVQKNLAVQPAPETSSNIRYRPAASSKRDSSFSAVTTGASCRRMAA
jgi:hypothetical protein